MTRILTIARTVWLEMIRRKDVYVLLILLGAILVILISLNIFGLGQAAGYVKDIGLMMAWIFAWILAVTVSTREVPQEESRGTIYPLLAKPISRFEFLAGKWLGCWSTVVVATFLFYLLVVGVSVLKGGAFDPIVILQGFCLHACATGIVAALGLAFSTRSNHDAAAALTFVLTGSSFLILPRVPELLMKASGFQGVALMVLYYLAPHLELFDMRKRIVHAYGPAPWGVFFGVMLYGVVFILLLLAIAWVSYRKKRFSRAAMV